MLDKFNRRINYLRISVTDRCNLRCTYCMPEEGITLLPHKEILSFDEIYEVVKVAVNYGIDKIRLTGGEPLIRRGIVDLVRMLKSIDGIKDLAMTTNGVMLEQYANDLKSAGLDRVNISLDTINSEKFRKITRNGDINQVFKGIEAAKMAGLKPIKVNCVVMKSSNEDDAVEVAEFCKKNNLQVRFIHMMNLETGEFSIVEGGEGGDCERCNRLRLTSNGMIKPCLFDNNEYNIREMGAENAIKMALAEKPICGSFNKSNKFYNIGG